MVERSAMSGSVGGSSDRRMSSLREALAIGGWKGFTKVTPHAHGWRVGSRSAGRTVTVAWVGPGPWPLACAVNSFRRMFDELSEKLDAVFARLRGRGVL